MGELRTTYSRVGILLVVLAAAQPAARALESPATEVAAEPVHDPRVFSVNGLEFTIDKDTGNLLKLAPEGMDAFIESAPAGASLLDVACPIEVFEPLRAATRGSSGVEIVSEAGGVTLRWPALALSRALFDIGGPIQASVSIRPDEDGRSVLLKCRIENHSGTKMGQVLFPDFTGLQPFAGKEDTYLRSGGFSMRPFLDLGLRKDMRWYAPDGRNTAEYKGGSAFDPMIMRWIDYGSHVGGLSIYPKVWAGYPYTRVRIHYVEAADTYRMMQVHEVPIEPGGAWESPEYCLTPHAGGWAKGIGPYREWVRDHVDRYVPVPEPIRRGLGFRSVWMCKGFPADTEHDVAYRFSDLPDLAREAKEHGLVELVAWFWQEGFQLPLPDPYPHLGTPEDLAEAARACKALGVNLSLFVSCLSLSEPSISRYGFPNPTEGYNYHPEFVPMLNPAYASRRATVISDVSSALWQEDVLASCLKIVRSYTPCLAWDQVMCDPNTGELYRIFEQVRAAARKIDPDATLAGESATSIEKDADLLDYTWNWLEYRPLEAFTASFPAPRLNVNVNREPLPVKLAFADSLFINAMPSRPDDANATARLTDYPRLSHALKVCAARREQFIDYFLDGELIGDGLLKASVEGVHVCAYVLPDRVMMVIVNTGRDAPIALACDLASWLESPSNTYQVRRYQEDGQLAGEETAHGGMVPIACKLDVGQLMCVEFLAK